MRLGRFIFAVLAAVVLSGCGLRLNPPDIALTGKPRPAYDGHVKVYWDEKTPSDMRYEEIGIVSAHCLVARCQWVQIIKVLQKKAAYYGANAIIIKYRETPLMKGETRSLTEQPDPNNPGASDAPVYSSETFTGKDMLAVAIRLD